MLDDIQHFILSLCIEILDSFHLELLANFASIDLNLSHMQKVHLTVCEMMDTWQ